MSRASPPLRSNLAALAHLHRSLLIAIALGLFAFGTLTARCAEFSDEPTYDGHPLSYWIKDVQLTSSKLPLPLTDEARTAVAHIGTNAIPFLMKWLREDPYGGFGADGIIQAFWVLGPSARSAIPAIANLATNQPENVLHPPNASPSGVALIGYGPLRALGGIGPDALPVLLTILTNSSAPGMRLGAIEAIEDMGTNGLPALPAPLRCVKDDNDMVAWNAVKALSVVAPRERATLAALEDILKGSKPRFRGEALMALANFGDEAVPILVQAFDDTNVGNYNIAFHALVIAAPNQLTNITVLTIAAKGLRSADIDRRSWSAQVLRAAGQQASGIGYDGMFPGGNMDTMLRDATNTLRRLAPQLLTHEPRR